MENTISQIDWSTYYQHPNGAVSFQMKDVPYKEAIETTMANTWANLESLYQKDPSSFKFTILNLKDDHSN